MTQRPSFDELQRFHRWFAIECNNRAWDLAAADARRSESERRELLANAYAAAFHWGEVGTALNHARADLLLAHAHAMLGEGPMALEHARRSLAFCESETCEPWDVAFAHAELAHAAAACGESLLHRKHYDRATELGQAIADEAERRQFFEEFGRIPAPGSE